MTAAHTPTPLACGSAPVDADTLFELMRPVSPRRSVRANVTGAAGGYISAPLPRQRPDHPVAWYLADSTQHFRLLVLDLDAGRHGPDTVQQDLATVRRWLGELGVPYLVACSGPTGGRHVWVRLHTAIDAPTMRRLATALHSVLPSLDHGMLHNPVSGAARPPGSAHRLGGHSHLDPQVHAGGHPITVDEARIIVADWMRGATSDQLDQLLTKLPTAATQHPPTRQPPQARPDPEPTPIGIKTDQHGHPYLTGHRRDLSPAAKATLATNHDPIDPASDMSSILFSVLLHAAHARWRFADIHQLIGLDITAFEHLRSGRGLPHTRIPRSATESRDILARQWTRAVLQAATRPRVHNDTTHHQHDNDIYLTVQSVQTAADANPWRWAGPAGPADRAVLDALCLTALEAHSLTVSLSVRRWADLTGFGRSTISRATRRLSSPDDTTHTWISLAAPADTTLAATWTLNRHQSPVSTVDQSGTQVVPTPARAPHVVGRAWEAHPTSWRPGTTGVALDKGAGRQTGGTAETSTDTEVIDVNEWNAMTATLSARLEHGRADIWTYAKGLGHHAARVHAQLLNGCSAVERISEVTGYSRPRAEYYVTVLVSAGLAKKGARSIRACGSVHRAARECGVDKTVARRTFGHVVEREVHAWWRAEVEWRCAHGKRRGQPRRIGRWRHASQQVELPINRVGPRSRYGRFPTRPDGRADYRAATEFVRGAL